jgi:hypothetical protein
MVLTERERRYCSDIADRVSKAREFLNSNVLAEPPEPTQWHSFVSALRKIQGNISNDGSFIATLLAKQYLNSKFGVDFDAAEKPQGAPGIDIDVKTPEGHRIVAELKTTVPYQGSDFGAQQAASFKKDFAKLAASDAKHKFLFVTDSSAFAALQRDKYTRLMPGVRIVHLASGQEHAA